VTFVTNSTPDEDADLDRPNRGTTYGNPGRLDGG